MITTSTIISTPPAITRKPSSIKKEEAFSLAKNTIKKIIHSQHDITSDGSASIPWALHLDQRYEIKNEVAQYFAHYYIHNPLLANKLRGEPAENLNTILKEISNYAPSCLVEQPFSYICSLREFRSPNITTLIYNDPLVTLSLITAGGCGIKSTDEDTKKGAFNLLIAIGKCAEHALSSSKEFNNNVSNNLETLMLVKNILYLAKEKETNTEIAQVLHKIDSEFEKIEDMILKHCIELKEGKVTEKIHQEAKKEEQPIKPKEQKATMGTLNFLD